jgi:beta-lactam-binding protein with PASTA domain
MRLILGSLAALVAAMAVGAGTVTAASRTTAARVRVPYVMHLRLDRAERTLRRHHLRYKEHGGGVFGIIVKHNWEVCFQSPRPGKRVSAGTRVALYVARPGQC